MPLYYTSFIPLDQATAKSPDNYQERQRLYMSFKRWGLQIGMHRAVDRGFFSFQPLAGLSAARAPQMCLMRSRKPGQMLFRQSRRLARLRYSTNGCLLAGIGVSYLAQHGYCKNLKFLDPRALKNFTDSSLTP